MMLLRLCPALLAAMILMLVSPAARAEDDEKLAKEVIKVASSLRRVCSGEPEILGSRNSVRQRLLESDLDSVLKDDRPDMATTRTEVAKILAKERDPLKKDPALTAEQQQEAELGARLDAQLKDLAGPVPFVVINDARIRDLPLRVDTVMRGALCKATCSADASVVDVCALEDATLAKAAVIADRETVSAILRHLEQTVTDIAGTRLDVSPLETLADRSPLVGLAEAVQKARSEDHGLLTGALTSAQLATTVTTAAQALAEVIVDRAKREAIGWLLDTMAAEACSSTDESAWVRSEVEQHWLPSLCTLAKKDRAGHYGAGAAQLSALQSAIRTDLEGMPGAALGLLMAHFYFERTFDPVEGVARASRPVASVLECSEPGTTAEHGGFDVCSDAAELRRATEAATRSMVGGGDPRVALDGLATAMDRINVAHTSGDTPEGFLKSPSLQLLACALSLGHHVGEAPSQATVLAALVDAPACWTLTGKGHPCLTDALKAASAPTRVLAIDARFGARELEQVTTLIDLHRKLRQPAQRVVSSTRALVEAIARLTPPASHDDSGEPGPGEPAERRAASMLSPPPTFDGAKQPKEAAEAARQYLEATISVRIRVDRAELLDAIADALEASAAIGAAGIDLLEQAKAKDLLPGLRYGVGADGAVLDTPAAAASRAWLASAAQHRVTQLELLAEVVRANGDGDWGALANRGLSLLTVVAAELNASTTTSKDAAKLLGALDVLGRHLGTMVAIATAQTSDEMAEALDAAANPPGGWKRKLGRGNLTLSLTAHAGLMAAAELRKGKYGTTREDWGRVYGQAPTLFLPVGVEVAIGFDSTALAVFVPVLDPAAFLGYDAHAEGRLPGPSPLTVLSPGLGVRVAFGKSPFGLMVFGVFRPKYRTWDANVNEPGAHALQLGAALTADVTLLRLYGKGR